MQVREQATDRRRATHACGQRRRCSLDLGIRAGDQRNVAVAEFAKGVDQAARVIDQHAFDQLAERTRVDYLDKQILDADRRREALAAERAGLDVDALEEAFEQLHLQHDTQKAALDELSEDVELRKQGVAAVQEQQRNGQNELAELRKQANGLRGRLASLETLQQAALGQEQGAAVAWLKARGLDSAARVGERLDVDAGWENALSTSACWSSLRCEIRSRWASACSSRW